MKLKSSIYALLLLLIVLPILSLATSDLISSEKQALLDFASATVIHTKRLNWNASTQVCSSWIGITCDVNQTRVLGIHLPGIGLVGSIPFNSLGKLDALRVLSLRSNILNGNLPSDILSIPSLQYLYLQNNNFSGPLPSSLSHKLIALDLSYNSISGNIPASFQNLTRLTVLKLQKNSISGTIPNLNIPSLKFLNLSYNNLNGSVPYSFQKFPKSSFVGNSLLCGQPLRNCSTTFSSPTPSPSPISSPSISTGHIYSSSNKKLGKNSLIALAIVGSAVLFFVVIVALVCCIKRKKAKGSVLFKGKASANGKNEKPPDFGSGVQEAEKNKLFFFPGCSYGFDLEDLLRASAEILGKGSGGTTYKAIMEDGTTVVVKRLKEVVVGKKEFEQQMEVLGKFGPHPNIAPLRAYYYSKDEKLIVYNYMPFGSLFVRLHENKDSGRNPLNWDARLKIIIGTAKGIAHIHSEGGTKFIHGNIKSSNVLLSQDLDACISDVGLASVMNYPPTMSRSIGYRAPEAYETRKITQKSDVYSFGVLLLEMLTGKSPLQYPGHDYVVDLPRWVRSVVREEWTAEVFDVEVLRGQYVEEEMVQMLQIALACVSKVPDTRPNMVQIVKMIEEIRPSDPKNRPSSESETSNLQTP